MSFVLVFFQSLGPEGYSCKPHFVPTSLQPDISNELVTRFSRSNLNGENSFTAKPTTEGLVDLPGMVRVDRTYEEFDLGGFKLSIPTTDIDFYYSELTKLPERQVNGKPYYKIHGWIHCVVLTPEHRTIILNQIERDRNAINAKIDAELAKLKASKEALKDVLVPVEQVKLDPKLN
jgi:hypothetical protein